jgi:hypothetical protein
MFILIFFLIKIILKITITAIYMPRQSIINDWARDTQILENFKGY